MPKKPVEIIRSFYAALGTGDAAAALGLMAEDIAWTSMWAYRPTGVGPAHVAAGVFAPLMRDWSSFAITPAQYIVEGEQVVSLGRFTGVHGATGKAVDAAYAHHWTVAGGEITRFQQYIDTLAIAEAGRP